MHRKYVALYLLLITLPQCFNDEHTHTYKDGDEVVLWMNTVGPYHNRQETYNYFSLPLCGGPKKQIGHYHETLGEALQGVELEFSGLDINFKVNAEKQKYCEISVTNEVYDSLRYAITNNYWYSMYLDDLPMWAPVGEFDKSDQVYIFTHRRLEIGHSGEQIVGVNLITESKQLLQKNEKIPLTYEIIWTQSSIKFEDRFEKYLDVNFFQHRVHWFSIFNSFMMVIFLVGLVTMILLRTLKRDYARYSKEDDYDDLERDLGDEYGWKQVHGDVFRPATNSALFSALVGSGVHVALVSLVMVTIATMSKLYEERGTFLSTAIFIYSLTSVINGFVGGSVYARMGGKRWIRQMLLGTFILPWFICGTAFIVNFVAMWYHASRAIPFITMLAVCAICVFVLLPLCLVGTVLGRNLAGQPDYPCRINAVPRPIPHKKWFLEPHMIILFGGILPFGSIFIEMYFIFTSFWAYKVYFVFGFTLLVLLILFVVTSCVAIVCTYFLLNSEDYRWPWTTFLAGASTSLYVYLYSFYYFFFKTKMYGLFQTLFYFSYMGLFCSCLGVMCGSIAYFAANKFVKKIYATVKID